MIEWLEKNKEWFFSGAGVAVIAFIIGIIKKVLNRSKSKNKNTQTVKAGNGSEINQAIEQSESNELDKNSNYQKAKTKDDSKITQTIKQG